MELQDGRMAEWQKVKKIEGTAFLLAFLQFCNPVILQFLAVSSVFAQIDPKTAMLERTGWEALEAGQLRAAAEAFREALAADPRNARLHLGAGTAAFLERRDEDAKAALERALALDAELARARALLGQVQHRMGALNDAIRTYDDLVRRVPGNRDARATLERWRREAELHDRMQRAIGERFTVSFEGPEDAAIAARALDALDRAFWRIGSTLGAYPIEPVSVVLYTTEQFSDITRSPSWAAGAYDGIIRVPMRGALNEREELDRVLAHEFSHALTHVLAPRNVPTWLNEGLATALEAEQGLDWATETVRRASSPVPLAALQNSFGRFGGNQARLAYATSALAAKRLLDEAGGFAVANLLRDLGSGAPFEAAFERRVQRTLAAFEATLQQ